MNRQWKQTGVVMLITSMSHIQPSAVLATDDIPLSGVLAATPWATAAEAFGLEVELLYGVALAESRRVLDRHLSAPWPWTLNISGQGFYFDTRAEAEQALSKALTSSKGNIDVGPMQINTRYHTWRVGDPLLLLDPEVNLRIGAAILAESLARDSDPVIAVGLYHAGSITTPGKRERAERYGSQVLAIVSALKGLRFSRSLENEKPEQALMEVGL